MPDAIFAVARLAEVYDLLEGERDDLDHYLAMATEFGARRVLDVGCGTGTFACLLAERGLEVTGVDPAAASLDIAQAKPGARRVRWVLGDATSLPELQVDLATMTANVGQVFLTDEEWSATLRGIHAATRAAEPPPRFGCGGLPWRPCRFGWLRSAVRLHECRTSEPRWSRGLSITVPPCWSNAPDSHLTS